MASSARAWPPLRKPVAALTFTVIAGIWISEGACPDLYANRCEGNANGLAYTEYAGGTASANVCGGNTLFGISVAALASPTVEDNVLNGNILGTIVDQRSSDTGPLVIPN